MLLIVFKDLSARQSQEAIDETSRVQGNFSNIFRLIGAKDSGEAAGVLLS